MQLNFYRKRNKSSPTIYYHFFFYPNKENPTFPTDFSFGKTPMWPISNKPLESHYVVEILKQAYFNGLGLGEDLFYPPYFFDAIHGYCKCDYIVNNYKKHIHDTGICDCVKNIKYCGKDLFSVNIVEQSEAINKWASFPNGFQRVLYVEPLILFDAQMYLVCSVNVLDVKPVQFNTYDVGISYDFIFSCFFSKLNIPMFAHLPRRERVRLELGYLKDLACSRFENDKFSYKETCVSFIEDWLNNGHLPKDQYYVHIYDYANNKMVNEDRIYISSSAYESCQSFFHDESLTKKTKKRK